MGKKSGYFISHFPPEYLLEDLSDCYTWSFPEFIPFCRELYTFSSMKEFNDHATR